MDLSFEDSKIKIQSRIEGGGSSSQ